MARIPGILASTALDVLVIASYSPNSVFASQSALDANWARVLDAVRQCQAAGVIPVLDTGCPRNSGSTLTNDNLRKQHNAQLIAYGAASNVIVADINSVIGDGGTPELIKSNYNIGDGLHWNRAGVDAAAAVDGAAIRAKLA